MKAALALGALATLTLAAPLAAQSVTVPTGQWYQVFAADIERAIGRSVRVDALSVAAGGLGRTFREAEVLLRASRQYPRGTTILSQRSVDCAGGRVMTTGFQVYSPTGAALATLPGTSMRRIVWDSEDGKVLKFVCQGILPR